MIYVFSVNHTSTPLEVREKLSLTAPQQQAFLGQAAEQEAVVLSTCNRLELYLEAADASAADACWQALLNETAWASQGQQHELIVEKAAGQAAAQHLMRVAGGLESSVLGEPQILGQVTAAYDQALAAGSAGPGLSLLFRAAIRTAKQIRTETDLSKGTVSFSSLGLKLAERAAGSLENAPVMLLGSGEMALSVAKVLEQRGMTANVTVISRTFENAKRLAERFGMVAKPMEYLPILLTQCAAVFATASTPEPLITRSLLEAVMPLRRTQALALIDLAVPRDIEPEVAEVPGVTLHNLESLTRAIENSLVERQQAVPAAEARVQQALQAFWKDYQARALAPTIRQIREHVEELRQAELARIANRMPPGHEEYLCLFDEFSQRLVNKVMHHPTAALRQKADQEDAALFASFARDLFGLKDQPEDA